jgi:hypothetical protein
MDESKTALADLKRAWSEDGWRAGGEARNEMVGEHIEAEDLDRVLDTARILAVLEEGRLKHGPTYVLQGRCTEGGMVCVLCRRAPSRVLIDHVFRTI